LDQLAQLALLDCRELLGPLDYKVVKEQQVQLELEPLAQLESLEFKEALALQE
jgi:hypothetical protein